MRSLTSWLEGRSPLVGLEINIMGHWDGWGSENNGHTAPWQQFLTMLLEGHR